ncbi:small integral membrane protein 13 [Drosophila suzukii]|uniref:Small integral membrane protein 13 n=1 Tax=Drosophila suzukii TaxID=28584 RepID=A0AB40A5D1_DROSZ|nr:small integral membrane protein 13 [Drosophila suzukii]XP_036671840.1 small integral membrane protein 13 [Drosophila suzukii]XP_037722019.1 small integral membrane protein 13 [Drosophila subpulchrella]XP_037722021.1 small integral membrane protein 13 [Drosophila subpulchrella]
MSLQTGLVFVFTILASVSIVAAIILLGWFLIWKAFLSKFRLVRELLGQEEPEEQQPLAWDHQNLQPQQPGRARKARRD